jgi:hypothetical protein
MTCRCISCTPNLGFSLSENTTHGQSRRPLIIVTFVLKLQQISIGCFSTSTYFVHAHRQCIGHRNTSHTLSYWVTILLQPRKAQWSSICVPNARATCSEYLVRGRIDGVAGWLTIWVQQSYAGMLYRGCWRKGIQHRYTSADITLCDILASTTYTARETQCFLEPCGSSSPRLRRCILSRH